MLLRCFTWIVPLHPELSGVSKIHVILRLRVKRRSKWSNRRELPKLCQWKLPINNPVLFVEKTCSAKKAPWAKIIWIIEVIFHWRCQYLQISGLIGILRTEVITCWQVSISGTRSCSKERFKMRLERLVFGERDNTVLDGTSYHPNMVYKMKKLSIFQLCKLIKCWRCD